MTDGELREKLSLSLRTGFIDAFTPSEEQLRPSLVLNHPPQTKVLASLVRELSVCASFAFSVAFVTRDGVASILSALDEARERGVSGKIITTDYLGFTDPEAIQFLRSYENIQVKVLSGKPFHAKGYVFFKDAEKTKATVIIGSANLTQEALAITKEWNVCLFALSSGELLHEIVGEFDQTWEASIDVSDAWLTHYRRIYKAMHARMDGYYPLPEGAEEEGRDYVFRPNLMQQEALCSLAALRKNGARKALVVSATGTGKTVLCALDVKAFRPRRCLFIVHREAIIKDAVDTFKHVFGPESDCSVIGGGKIRTDARFTFAMIQTLSRPDVLERLDPKTFQYIIVDEVHHSGGATYQTVMRHFNADFWLGMTATPERSDGFDIYRFFDYNVAYDIRLAQALDAGLLCPFHYYGVTDLTVNGEEVSDHTDFNRLVDDERIKRIREKILRYSLGNPEVRGLIFCSRVEEGKKLAEKLRTTGMRIQSLCGEDSEETREDAVKRLQAPKDQDGHLDWLVTVDIFNEGVDIPCVNQIVMLRPTKSSIVFVQQLGRGLRLYPGKKFVSVLDFIGNYEHNYMIPVALFGDTSYKKESMRKVVIEGSLAVNGVSTVDFDRISRKRILDAVNTEKYAQFRNLKVLYGEVKKRCGRVPRLGDFERCGGPNPLLLIERSDGTLKSYPAFLLRADPSAYHPMFTTRMMQSLAFLSSVLAAGKRPYENLIIRRFLDGRYPFPVASVEQEVSENFKYPVGRLCVESACEILSDRFFKESDRKKFGNMSYCRTESGVIGPTDEFLALLNNEEYRMQVSDLADFGLSQFGKRDLAGGRRENDFVLYDRYTRQDVCRLLCWTKDVASTIYGYKIDYERTKTCPIFVTYAKDSGRIDASIDYKDKFESEEVFSWFTRSGIRRDGKEPTAIRSGAVRNLLFVKKNDDEGGDFYYMGEMDYLSDEETTMEDGKGKAIAVVHMRFRMHDPVADPIYAYLCDGTTWDAKRSVPARGMVG